MNSDTPVTQPMNAFVATRYECFKLADGLYYVELNGPKGDDIIGIVVPEQLLTAISLKPYASHEVLKPEMYR